MDTIEVKNIELIAQLARSGVDAGVAARTIIDTSEVSWCVVRFAPGGHASHDEEDIVRLVYQVSGQATLSIDGEQQHIESGQFVMVPEGARYEVTADGEGCEQVVFLGLDQLLGGFFNTYRGGNAK